LAPVISSFDLPVDVQRILARILWQWRMPRRHTSVSFKSATTTTKTRRCTCTLVW